MKLLPTQLTTALNKPLAPFYCVSGDEPLLVQETCDQIRFAAAQKGFSERLSVTADSLLGQAKSVSLFSPQQLLEWDLTASKLNAVTGKLLQEYAASSSKDKILLIRSSKLDAKTEQTQWYKALDHIGVFISLWPIPFEQLPAWIMERAKKNSLFLTKEAAQALAIRVEGNLLAAAQELEKLALLNPDKTIDEALINETVTDLAHFDLFMLVDSALAGNKQRSLQILENLIAENTEPVLILWALTRDIRVAANVSQHLHTGKPLSALFSQFRIWEKRQSIMRAFLKRHPSQEHYWTLLSEAAAIDRMIKGALPGDPWQHLQRWVLAMCDKSA